jgi:hypothetical protein
MAYFLAIKKNESLIKGMMNLKCVMLSERCQHSKQLLLLCEILERQKAAQQLPGDRSGGRGGDGNV